MIREREGEWLTQRKNKNGEGELDTGTKVSEKEGDGILRRGTQKRERGGGK